jgi:hypothetical protein
MEPQTLTSSRYYDTWVQHSLQWLGYALDDWEFRVPLLQWQEFHLCSRQTGSVSHTVVIRDKVARAHSWNSPHPAPALSLKLYLHSPYILFMRWLKEHRHKLTFIVCMHVPNNCKNYDTAMNNFLISLFKKMANNINYRTLQSLFVNNCDWVHMHMQGGGVWCVCVCVWCVCVHARVRACLKQSNNVIFKSLYNINIIPTANHHAFHLMLPVSVALPSSTSVVT